MSKAQIEEIRNCAPVAFEQIKREHSCDDEEAALILADTIEANNAS